MRLQCKHKSSTGPTRNGFLPTKDEAETCDEWKAGWSYSVLGLFPDMTQEKFFSDIVGEDIDPEDCEEILEANLFDF